MRIRLKPVQKVLLISVILIWLIPASITLAKEQTQSGVVSPSELIWAMNSLRVANGLPALIEDPIVNAVAQATAVYMAQNNLSWHIGDVRGRIAAAGYGGGATVWATENFAMGNMSIDRIMQVWDDPDHMRPAVNPAYCHVGAGVAQAANGNYYYVLQAAYTSSNACGDYEPIPGETPVVGGEDPVDIVPQIIIPVMVSTPDPDGRIYHIVQAGQSFWSIAIAYKTTIADLERWNNISSDIGLVVGQKLFIPSSNTEGYSTPTPLGMVILATPNAKGQIIHEVKPYQALILIAEAYEVSVDEILRLNGILAEWPLQVGQKLLIAQGKTTPGPTAQPLSPIEKLTPASDGNYYHEVVAGENLTGIATTYQVPLSDLLAWNGLSADSIIQPGLQLYLPVTPPPTGTPTPTRAIPTAQPITPSATPTPILPTSKQELETPLASTPEVSDEANNSALSKIALPLGIGLALTGLFIVGWMLRKKNLSTSEKPK